MNRMKKYELTNETKIWCGKTLYRIKALKSFGNILKGELGGFIEKEDNLSQDGDAWVSGNARVSGKIKLNFGWCFGRTRKNWDVTELENEDEILLIKDYKPATEEQTELTMEEIANKFNIDVENLKIKKGAE